MPRIFPFILSLLLLSSCADEEPLYVSKSMDVTITAYNSFRSQTQGDPRITAFGDTLEPGMKVVAVSRDLLDSGLTHNSVITIEGLPGSYLVKDKMHRRWRRRIDLYMGNNYDSARTWGRQTRQICWVVDTIYP